MYYTDDVAKCPRNIKGASVLLENILGRGNFMSKSMEHGSDVQPCLKDKRKFCVARR